MASTSMPADDTHCTLRVITPLPQVTEQSLHAPVFQKYSTSGPAALAATVRERLHDGVPDNDRDVDTVVDVVVDAVVDVDITGDVDAEGGFDIVAVAIDVAVRVIEPDKVTVPVEELLPVAVFDNGDCVTDGVIDTVDELLARTVDVAVIVGVPLDDPVSLPVTDAVILPLALPDAVDDSDTDDDTELVVDDRSFTVPDSVVNTVWLPDDGTTTAVRVTIVPVASCVADTVILYGAVDTLPSSDDDADTSSM